VVSDFYIYQNALCNN